MVAALLTKNAINMAEEALAQQGKVFGMVILHAREGLFVLPYKDGSMPVDIQQDIIIGIVRSCRMAGAFHGLVMISEAWTAPVTNDALVGVLRPANDPDRKEIVLAWAYGADGSKQMVMADIIRNGKAVSLGEKQVQEHEVSSWLDDAFKD